MPQCYVTHWGHVSSSLWAFLLLHLLLSASSSIRLPTPPSTLSFPELPPALRPAAGAARRLRTPMLGTPRLRMPMETAEVGPWTPPLLHTLVFLLCLSVHTADFLLNQPPPVNRHVFNLPGAFFLTWWMHLFFTSKGLGTHSWSFTLTLTWLSSQICLSDVSTVF